MKDAIFGIKNIVEGIKNRLDEADDWIRYLENGIEKHNQNSKWKNTLKG